MFINIDMTADDTIYSGSSPSNIIDTATVILSLKSYKREDTEKNKTTVR